MSALDTKDWVFYMQAGFKRKEPDEEQKCPVCSGRGLTGDHFKSIDGPISCSTCGGTGVSIVIRDREPRPDVPAELLEHMRASLTEWIAAKEEGK